MSLLVARLSQDKPKVGTVGKVEKLGTGRKFGKLGKRSVVFAD